MTKRTKTEAAPESPMPNASKVASGKIAVLTGLLRQRVASGGDPSLRSLAQRLPAELFDRYLAEVQTALERVHGAADKKLVIESLLIGWVALLARAGRAAQNPGT